MNRQLIRAIIREFQSAGDSDRAAGQQAYMKSEMPYFGIATPQMRKICRACFTEHLLTGATDWEETILALCGRLGFERVLQDLAGNRHGLHRRQ